MADKKLARPGHLLPGIVGWDNNLQTKLKLIDHGRATASKVIPEPQDKGKNRQVTGCKFCNGKDI